MRRATGHVELLLLAVIILLGFVLRYQRLGWDAIHMDEMWHLALSTGHGSPHLSLPRNVLNEQVPSFTQLNGAKPWWTVPAHVAPEATHPPLYALVLRIWREFAGPGDHAAQWMSLIISMLGIPLLWRAARTSFGAAAGLWTAAVFAVAPTQVFMAQEIRAYALLATLGCWTLWILARIDRKGATRGNMLELSVASLAMMLTHYFAIGAAVAVGAFLVIRLRGRERAVACASLLAAALVYVLLWGGSFRTQLRYAAKATTDFLADPSANHVALTLRRSLELPARLLAEMPLIGVGSLLAILAAVAVAALLLMKRRRETLPWCLWIVGSIGFLVVLDLTRHTRHLAFIRYAMIASPAICGVAVAALQWRKTIIANAAAGVLVLALIAASSTAFVEDAPQYESLLNALRTRARPDDVFVFYSGASNELHMEALALAASRAGDLWPRSIVMLTTSEDEQLRAKLAGRRIILISGEIRPFVNPIANSKLVEAVVVRNADQRLIAQISVLQCE